MSDQAANRWSSFRSKGFYRWTIRIFIFLLLLFFAFRLCFTISGIHTPSMRGTLMEGDRILISKCSSVSRNDVIVFDSPSGDSISGLKEEYVKRCIGLPGETIAIEDGKVTIDGKMIEDPAHVQKLYDLQTDGTLDTSLFHELSDDIIVQGQWDGIHYRVNISESNAAILRSKPHVTAVTRRSFPPGYFDPSIFPNSSEVKWNSDYFGPLFIPKKESSVKLDAKNFLLYKTVIGKDEGNIIEAKGDSVFVNGKYAEKYVFTKNYYFVLGDNRYNSIDSRYWGFVPEENIKGEVCFILSSTQNGIFSPTVSRSFSSVK